MAKVAIENAARSNVFLVDPERFCLPLIDYECGPDDPAYCARNKMAVDEAMVASIMRLGVLEPVKVIKRGEELIPIYGNQRIRAAREANKRLRAAGKRGAELVKVPTLAPERGATDDDLAEMAVAENEIRQATGPSAKAELAAIMVRRRGSVSEAAKAFGLSPQQFRGLLALNEATGELKQALKAGKLSTSAAVEVASLPKAEQPRRLAQVLAAGGTYEAARNAARKAKGKSTTTRPNASLLRAILEAHPSESPLWRTLGPRDALRWVAGEVKGEELSGIAAALRSLESEEA